MEVVYERCAGLDVHEKTVVACVLAPGDDGRVARMIRRFETMLDNLEALARWLAEQVVTHVAMESTGGTGSRSGTCWRSTAGSSCCW